MTSPLFAWLRADFVNAVGRPAAVALVVILLASPLHANAQASQHAFSRVSANAYGTVLDPCGVTQTAVTISTFGVKSLEEVPNATASVVVYRFDSCKRTSVFAYGSSRRCDLSVGAASDGRLPESVTVSGKLPLSVFTSSGNSRDTATFELTLHLVNAPSAYRDENPVDATIDAPSKGLYDYNIDASGAMTLPTLGLRSFPLPNGQMKFER
ncbi:hypothetical protein [Burkholderia sp. Ac-20353]|uniref:hypothetical protein n=1 Tax=Burkholderia sp. Ac-20353 TaxID=2703894 RepID=UPI00197BB96B|nr:hypothetical protein [Burkholderia sp. Ac-20353]MBN3791816.1 hypothetical protein [Burkholderia sp. Ac-20353]